MKPKDDLEERAKWTGMPCLKCGHRGVLHRESQGLVLIFCDWCGFSWNEAENAGKRWKHPEKA